MREKRLLSWTVTPEGRPRPIRRIRKKCWPGPFEDIMAGRKKADVRLLDFECEPGDTLILQEWDPTIEKYSGRELSFTVTHVLKTNKMNYFSREEVEKFGYQVMSLGEIQG